VIDLDQSLSPTPVTPTDVTALVDLSRLPVLPSAVTEVLRLTESATSSAGAVAQAVQQDPVLAARVLRIANSGYFNFHSSVSGVQQAVTLMGLDLVRSVVVGAAISRLLRPDHTVPGFSLQRFWRHSAMTASGSRGIAQTTATRGREDAFTAGLLHDIGALVLACSQPEAYASVLQEGRLSGRPLAWVERRQLGTDHAEVGGVVARHWHLPPALVDVIRFHHAPAQAGEHSRLAAAVHLSDCVSHGVGEPGIETAPTPSMCSDVWTLLGGLAAGMGPDEIHRCVSRLREEAPSVEMLTGVLAAA